MASLLLTVAMLTVGCQDQPLDTGEDGTANIDTTILVERDTVVLSLTDTVVVTRVDTIFQSRIDTIEVERVVRDTLRDTITKVRIDTIHVPIASTQFRSGWLRYQGRSDSTDPNAPTDRVEIDISDWLQYHVVDSNGTIVGVGFSVNASIPGPKSHFVIGTNQLSSIRHRLRGIALVVPVFRVGSAMRGDSILLRRHPFDVSAQGFPGGGALISVQKSNTIEPIHLWTGQQNEIDRQPGVDVVQSIGVLRIEEVDTGRSVITGHVELRFWIPIEIQGRRSVVPFDAEIELELGY